MIARQLLDAPVAHAVGTAVTDVADEDTARQERQRRAGRAHPLEIDGALAAGMDLRVGLLDAPAQRERGRTGRELLVGEGDLFHGDGAGHLPGGVRAHAVGHDEQPAPPPVLLATPGLEHGLRVLIVGPSAPDVGTVAVLEAEA